VLANDLQLAVVVQPLENGLLLAAALLFPEFTCAGDDADALAERLAEHAERLLRQLPPEELYRRFLTDRPVIGGMSLSVEPAVRSPAWQKPVELRFAVLRWTHAAPTDTAEEPPPEAVLAYVPALGIEVLAKRPADLDRMLESHVRAALTRRRAGESLGQLVWLQRSTDVRQLLHDCAIELASPKQKAIEEADERERAKSVLPEVGVNLAAQTLAPAYTVADIVERLAEYLTGRTPQCVLLIGPSGVGKTAVVHELVRRRADLGLGATPFWATSGARLVAGMCGFGMWQERCQRLWREASRQRAILHLGNLMELIEVGKSEHQSQGIASFLRPYLARGDLLAIAECTPEQLPLIDRMEPGLCGAFVRLNVAEPGPERGRTILENVARAACGVARSGAPPITPEALQKLDRLHRRYATYSAYPGRPLRFLQGLLADLGHGPTRQPADVTAAFARETGLPRFLLEESELLDLAEARRWFARRVIGQPEAVDLVVDLLATVKAELARPRKPLASLLFIGPTGVGKTEMAKSLAAYLFGSAARLTRFDMSEYADPLAVQRLIGSPWQEEGLLTARVREQPFSVVLLDEVEKADPQLFDLLLQVLGEGRLTDAHGRLADFCNSVVIMTSNLGAETYQQGVFGLIHNADTRAQAHAHFTRAVEAFVRPELFNRIDRVVPFAPLDADAIRTIARRQLDLVQQRDGVRYRGVLLDVAAEVADCLARKGYDPRYGARPLKRAIERELLAPLADQLNGYSGDTPLRAAVELREDQLSIKVRARTDETGRQLGSGGTVAAAAELVTAGLDLRREMQRLERSAAGLEMHNEIARLAHLAKRHRPGAWTSAEDASDLDRLGQWQRLRDAQQALFGRICALEDANLLALYGRGTLDADGLARALDELGRQWENRLIELFLMRERHGDRVTLGIFSEQPALLVQLAQAYWKTAAYRKARSALWQYQPPAHDKPGKPLLRFVLDPERLFHGAPKVAVRRWDPEAGTLRPQESVDATMGVIGCALTIKGPAVQLRFAEDGLHIFRDPKGGGRCLVDVRAGDISTYEPPEGIERRGAVAGQPKRRVYQLERGEAEDALLGVKLRADELHEIIDEATERMMRRRLREMLDS
jgi:ATP-dependent Clp protease ATP-binding subunit ClpA